MAILINQTNVALRRQMQCMGARRTTSPKVGVHFLVTRNRVVSRSIGGLVRDE